MTPPHSWRSSKNTAGEPMTETIIDDGSTVEIRTRSGLLPRDYADMPVRAVQMTTIPRSEWSARIKEQTERKARLSDVWKMSGLKFLSQGQYGYCWAHSSAHAVMALRAVANLPAADLSAFAVAATIKGGRDEGGWSALSLQFMAERGIPEQRFWPQGSASLAHGTQACWDNAQRFKVTESWADVSAPVWDRDLSFDQMATCLLVGVPVACDFMWWGHAVCALDLVDLGSNQFGVRIVNSWEGWSQGDQWGMAVLTGSKAVPDNAVAPRSVVTY